MPKKGVFLSRVTKVSGLLAGIFLLCSNLQAMQQEQGTHEAKEAEALIAVAGQTQRIENPEHYEELVIAELRQTIESLGFSKQDTSDVMKVSLCGMRFSFEDVFRLSVKRELAAYHKNNREEIIRKESSFRANSLENAVWHVTAISKARADKAEKNLKDYYRFLNILALEKVLGIALLIVVGIVNCA